MSTVSKEIKIYLCPEMAGSLMTPEEFDAVEEYDDNYVYELINGVVVASPIPAISERDPNEELGHLLRSYKKDHPQGSALDKTVMEEYLRTKRSRRRADRVIWAGLGRVPNPKVDVPTIAVEFVSAAKRDRYRDYQTKRREYLKLGVEEYWVIDRFRRNMTVYRPARPALVIKAGETYSTPLLPGFIVPLARLFALADDWKRAK